MNMWNSIDHIPSEMILLEVLHQKHLDFALVLLSLLVEYLWRVEQNCDTTGTCSLVRMWNSERSTGSRALDTYNISGEARGESFSIVRLHVRYIPTLSTCARCRPNGSWETNSHLSFDIASPHIRRDFRQLFTTDQFVPVMRQVRDWILIRLMVQILIVTIELLIVLGEAALMPNTRSLIRSSNILFTTHLIQP